MKGSFEVKKLEENYKSLKVRNLKWNAIFKTRMYAKAMIPFWSRFFTKQQRLTRSVLTEKRDILIDHVIPELNQKSRQLENYAFELVPPDIRFGEMVHEAFYWSF